MYVLLWCQPPSHPTCLDFWGKREMAQKGKQWGSLLLSPGVSRAQSSTLDLQAQKAALLFRKLSTAFEIRISFPLTRGCRGPLSMFIFYAVF